MFWYFMLALVVGGAIIGALSESGALATQSAGDAEKVCPHCQTKGHVTTWKATQSKGISGGKATGAILTGGVSLLATGLAKKELVTKARCSNCNAEWYF